MTIRNPAPHDRLVKAVSIDTSYYEIFDLGHVRSKFPAAKVMSSDCHTLNVANCMGKEHLAIRLGKSISRRRQYLKYCERHHKKLAQDMIATHKPIDQPRSHPVDSMPERPLTDEDGASKKISEVSTFLRVEAAPSMVATTVLTQTTASEFIPSTADFDVESESGQTSTSYATTLSGGGKLSIPPMPKESAEGRPFECPYCFTIVSIKNSQAWKKHIFRDLQPYVCTFEHCSKSAKLFDSRRDWFDHELQVHRKEWLCTADCEKSFGIQAEFEAHMRDFHAIGAQNQLTAVSEVCQRPVDEDAEAQCAICTETLKSMKQLCRHIARHLEELALFALPRSKDEEQEEEFGSDRVQASDLSRGFSEGSLSFASNSEVGDASLDPDSDVEDIINSADAVGRSSHCLLNSQKTNVI